MVVKLVKAEEVQKYIKDYGHGAIEDGKAALDPVDDILAIAKIVDFMPGVDAEEVVRCKDCKYGDMEFEGKCYLCRANWHRDGSRRRMMPYEFCSSGKRRDDGTSQN